MASSANKNTDEKEQRDGMSLIVGAAPPLNYRLALWTDLAVGANGPPIH